VFWAGLSILFPGSPAASGSFLRTLGILKTSSLKSLYSVLPYYPKPHPFNSLCPLCLCVHYFLRIELFAHAYIVFSGFISVCHKPLIPV
jgi:hypothetical protein